jgi:hypothetical protein
MWRHWNLAAILHKHTVTTALVFIKSKTETIKRFNTTEFSYFCICFRMSDVLHWVDCAAAVSDSVRVRAAWDSASGASSRRWRAARGTNRTIAGRRLSVRVGCDRSPLGGSTLGKDSLADVSQSVGDMSGETVAPEHVTHVFPGRAVAGHVREISVTDRNKQSWKSNKPSEIQRQEYSSCT